MEQSYWTYLDNNGSPVHSDWESDVAVINYLMDVKHEGDEAFEAEYTIVRMDFAPNEIDDYHIGHSKEVSIRRGWPSNYEPHDFYD